MEENIPKPGGIVVFSGGTAANFLVDVFNIIIQKRGCPLSYVIPISDNGGSSSELIRVFGGPSVGDIRSRLVRLIPSQTDNGDEENTALRALFEHRLSTDPTQAKAEWLEIVEGSHLLWSFISSPKRELIRSVLNTLNMEIVKRSRPTSLFNFSKASVGNMFLTGARIFSGSFEAAIYLLSIICRIPTTVSVLPSINSNFTHHIAASLGDGTTLTGQVAISHPSEPTAVPDAGGASGMGSVFGGGGGGGGGGWGAGGGGGRGRDAPGVAVGAAVAQHQLQQGRRGGPAGADPARVVHQPLRTRDLARGEPKGPGGAAGVRHGRLQHRQPLHEHHPQPDPARRRGRLGGGWGRGRGRQQQQQHFGGNSSPQEGPDTQRHRGSRDGPAVGPNGRGRFRQGAGVRGGQQPAGGRHVHGRRG
ncbi:hypothetical protein MAPG_05524 [Magnaporthiopsis poae ATCC 64411]|uniref:Uncharacterized protein n=1 Tax=Magnaporthiopsis poae (strain ATCC 64411 / 73-15) TaxID=644358 RepID=A0A0C4DZL9_MAGP6|nr:hypothetical protein MAPG_05524 [Magnaporthiopsis poae ATCC 64411]